MNNTNTIINSLINQSFKLLKQNNYEQAQIYFKKIISINPDIYEIHNNLGLIDFKFGNYDDAIKSFEKSININNKFSEGFGNLGVVYSKINKFEKAIECYEKAIKLDPKNYIFYYNLGNIFKYSDVRKSEKYFKKTIELKPDLFSAYNNLFNLYDNTNDNSRFLLLLDIAKANNFNNIYLNFFQGIYEFKVKNYLKAIKILKNLKLEVNDYKRLIKKNELLAKSYDFTNNFDLAFDHFKLMNEYSSKAYNNFDKSKYLKTLDNRIKYFNKSNFNKWKLVTLKNREIDPTFLIGFPRSGTTLLDKILSSHDHIEVIEEKPIVENFVKFLHKKINSNLSNLENINDTQFHEIRKNYIDNKVKFLKNKNLLTIDKLPLNIVYVGEIIRFFPNAKFIFAVRNPYDCVLSCYMQNFYLNDAMSNFLNIQDAAKLYDRVMRLWIQYRSNLKIDYHIVKYEDVVFNFDKTILNLFNFLNLEWTEKVKKFYKNNSIVNTPSYNQVNLPLYTRSIDRYKKYFEKFSKVKTLLDRWSREFGY
jgi:hypothetical protein